VEGSDTGDTSDTKTSTTTNNIKRPDWDLNEEY
jgi:hypothetical protein